MFGQKLVKAQKAPQQIIQTIREAILKGELPPGSRLPSEAELIDHFGVSRQTVREALRALEAFGLLSIKAGNKGGAFVSEVDMNVAQLGLSNFLFGRVGLEHLAHVRRAIEPYAAKLATKRMTSATLEILEKNLQASYAALENKDYVTLRKLEVDFHHYIVEAAGCPIFLLVHDFVQDVVLDMKNHLETKDDFSEKILASHSRLLKLLKKGDPEAVEKAVVEHVGVMEEALKRVKDGEHFLRWK